MERGVACITQATCSGPAGDDRFPSCYLGMSSSASVVWPFDVNVIRRSSVTRQLNRSSVLDSALGLPTLAASLSRSLDYPQDDGN